MFFAFFEKKCVEGLNFKVNEIVSFFYVKTTLDLKNQKSYFIFTYYVLIIQI